MKVRPTNRRKKALSSIIGGVIVFGMIFSIGFGYFYSITQSQQAYQKTVKLENQVSVLRSEENLEVIGSAPSSYLYFTITNLGISANVTGYFVNNNSTGISSYTSISGGQFVPQDQSVLIPTNTPFVPTDNYLIKILTARGNLFTATYPPTATSLAAQALSSGAIGDLYLQLGSYTWYTVSSCGGSNCLQKQGLGFSIPVSKGVCNTCYTAFSVSITDLNPTQLNITLDQYTQILMFWGQGSSFRTQSWYIISNSSNTILSSYTPMTLFYNKPVTLVFGSGTSGSFSTASLSGNNAPTSGTIASVFIVSHGWKAIKTSQQTLSNSNYGQNSPYVTSLFD